MSYIHVIVNTGPFFLYILLRTRVKNEQERTRFSLQIQPSCFIPQCELSVSQRDSTLYYLLLLLLTDTGYSTLFTLQLHPNQRSTDLSSLFAPGLSSPSPCLPDNRSIGLRPCFIRPQPILPSLLLFLVFITNPLLFPFSFSSFPFSSSFFPTSSSYYYSVSLQRTTDRKVGRDTLSAWAKEQCKWEQGLR